MRLAWWDVQNQKLMQLRINVKRLAKIFDFLYIVCYSAIQELYEFEKICKSLHGTIKMKSKTTDTRMQFRCLR